MFASSFVASICILSFSCLVFLGALSDIRSYLIPNRICLAIALLFPVFVISSPQAVAWGPALITAGGVLVGGFLLFALNLFGAGDAKFLAVIALWAGPNQVLPLILITALCGGIFAVTIWIQARLAAAPTPAMALVTGAEKGFARQPMPYGAAIAVGALYLAFTLTSVS
jgi:prepilin peptidase CpaA